MDVQKLSGVSTTNYTSANTNKVTPPINKEEIKQSNCIDTFTPTSKSNSSEIEKALKKAENASSSEKRRELLFNAMQKYIPDEDKKQISSLMQPIEKETGADITARVALVNNLFKKYSPDTVPKANLDETEQIKVPAEFHKYSHGITDKIGRLAKGEYANEYPSLVAKIKEISNHEHDQTAIQELSSKITKDTIDDFAKLKPETGTIMKKAIDYPWSTITKVLEKPAEQKSFLKTIFKFLK